MNTIKKRGRLAGLLYVVASVFGVFGLLCVPSKLIVHGDAAATARNIVASETLFRLGIAANLIGQALFIFVALALYDLLKPVNPRHDLIMPALILVAGPIALLNELNAIAALLLVRGADFLSIIDQPQRDALAMLFLGCMATDSILPESSGGSGYFLSAYSFTVRDSFRAFSG